MDAQMGIAGVSAVFFSSLFSGLADGCAQGKLVDLQGRLDSEVAESGIALGHALVQLILTVGCWLRHCGSCKEYPGVANGRSQQTSERGVDGNADSLGFSTREHLDFRLHVMLRCFALRKQISNAAEGGQTLVWGQG
jgi:hypothetical protein